MTEQSTRPARVPERFLSMPGVDAYQLEVAEARDVAPGIRRLVLTGPTIGKLDFWPGQDVMVPMLSDGRVLTRRYTIRRLDRAAGRLTLDIVLHGDGPGMRWASDARPGDAIEVAGPRGKIALREGAAWYGFVGDETAVPMATAMMEAAAAPVRAILEIEQQSDGDNWTRESPKAGGVDWLPRDGANPGDPARLLDAVRTADWPDGDGQIYISGEVSTVKALTQALLDRGFRQEQLSPKAYWSLGKANGQHGEPEK
jgi:NADPH-dependent ferric siderophore reductase